MLRRSVGICCLLDLLLYFSGKPDCRVDTQELEVRLRQLANNDVVSNPSDYITKAEHARILDSRMASKDHDSSGELARRAADAERQLSIRLKAQAAELQEVHAEQLSRLQRKHESELAERAQRLQAQHEEVLQMKRAVKAAEEHAQAAKDAQQRLQVTLSQINFPARDLRMYALTVDIDDSSLGCKIILYLLISYHLCRGVSLLWRKPSQSWRISEKRLCARCSISSRS